jgi:hypothetical protein
MKAKLRWLCVLPLAVVLLFLALSGFALGQGPVLTSLPTPTPIPFGTEVVSSSDLGAQDIPPDLIVEKIQTSPAIPLVGQPSVISVTIKNQGPGSVRPDNNFLVDLYIDPPRTPVVNYHQIISPTLGLPWGAQGWFVETPGTSYVFTTTWVFTDVKTFDVWAQVDSNGESVEDSDGNITEANEGNNTRKARLNVLTAQRFTHDTHQDFLTNMASSLDNSDPYGALRLGLFTEPPFFERPFANASCEITSMIVIHDYNMETPDARVNQVMAGPQVITGTQVVPHLIANGEGVVIAVWEDGRNGDIYNRDIYLRYSTDEGQTWGEEIRVNDDPIDNHVNQLNPVAALSKDGNLLVAWQDRRNGVDYDIYVQRFLISGTNLITSGGNIRVGEAGSHIQGDQINPDIAVDEAGGFYVVWQDNRNGNYDIFATSYISVAGSYTWSNVTRVNDDPNQTQQSNPAINVMDWAKVTDIDYEVGPGPDYEVTVTQIFTQPVTVLAVIWEDYRKENADIAIAISTDGGTTFGFDDFINDDADPGDPPDPLAPDQLDPDVTLTKDKTTATISVPLPDGRTAQVEVEVPVTGIHTVWQDYRNGPLDPDIYYSLSQFGVKQVGSNFDPELFLGGNAKINQNDSRAWQTTPVEQAAPTITAFPCGGDADETGWNVFIAWADGRNYDSYNYDVYYTVRSTCEGMPQGLATNLMLNDGVRLYHYDASNPSYDDYDAGNPPPARQLNPSVAADIQTNWPYVLGGYLYLAWEDDRAGNPQAQWDIYFARSNLTFFNHHVPDVISGTFGYGAGSQISNILDSESDDTTWYTVDWSAATDASTYLTVQTRLGDTITDVLNSAWYPQRFPHQPQPWDCAAYDSGAPLPGYNAPGQHIEDASGTFWPQARYIQYRVNFYTRESTNTPVLDNLTLYFDNGIRPDDGGNGEKSYIYLPMVLK